MPESPTPSVAAVTWNWRASRENGPPTGRPYRRLALIQGSIMILFAVVIALVFKHALTSRIIAGLGVLVIALGLFAPRAYRPIHGFGQALGRFVGQVLVYVLLVPFFYLVFLPGALILRLQKRDPLHRHYREARWSYWIRRSTVDSRENISRQFLRENREARAELRNVDAPPPDREAPRS
jgi:hypothetical protein